MQPVKLADRSSVRISSFSLIPTFSAEARPAIWRRTRCRLQSVLSERARSRPGILHERGYLHELDGWAHTVEAGYPLEQLVIEERFGRVV